MLNRTDPSIGSGSVAVIGGGISGMSVAIEAAEAGLTAHIIERDPSIGGRVAQLHKYFPKLCPPICGLEINFRRIRVNPNIRVHTQSSLTAVRGAPGNYELTIETRPRMVNERCTSCGDCVQACPVERDSDFDFGMCRTKAIYLPHPMSSPPRYVIDPAVCPGESCAACVKACKYAAIDLGMKPSTQVLRVGAIVVATGWKPYDATRLTNLGFGMHKDVITNVMLERLVSPQGPTHGKLVRPSDGKPPRSVVFVQCAGSRDEKHLPYCSGVCCAASLKQATYVRDLAPEATITICYIDIRTPGRLEDFFAKVRTSGDVTLERGKVARVREGDGTLLVDLEDTLRGELRQLRADLVVLATGMEPNLASERLPLQIPMDDLGFGMTDVDQTGVIVAGCAKRPFDVARSVQDATGAAVRALQVNARRASRG